MSRIVLAVTGSVAALRTPELYRRLISDGHAVRVLATDPALHFFDPGELAPPEPDPSWPAGLPDTAILLDADEWPDRQYRRDDPVLHIEIRRWADALVIAPLDANTLAKFANGLADNALTCLVRAWDFSRPIVLAPAMNTLMWETPVTVRHWRTLLDDRGDGRHPARFELDAVPGLFARHCPGIVVVPPQSKRLACGDVGMGAMADLDTIVEAVRQAIAATDRPPGPIREETPRPETGRQLPGSASREIPASGHGDRGSA